MRPVFGRPEGQTRHAVIGTRVGRNASQSREWKKLLDQIRTGGYYFFDLDLTAKEAESLEVVSYMGMGSNFSRWLHEPYFNGGLYANGR